MSVDSKFGWECLLQSNISVDSVMKREFLFDVNGNYLIKKSHFKRNNLVCLIKVMYMYFKGQINKH